MAVCECADTERCKCLRITVDNWTLYDQRTGTLGSTTLYNQRAARTMMKFSIDIFSSKKLQKREICELKNH